jgi:hypothetical protein
MGIEPAYPVVLITHLCDNRRIRPVQVGKAREFVGLMSRLHGFSTVLAASFPLLASASAGRRGGVGRR